MRSGDELHHFNLLACKLHLKFIEILFSLLEHLFDLKTRHFDMGFNFIFEMEDMIYGHLIIEIMQGIF
jgi:hypothetical protein